MSKKADTENTYLGVKLRPETMEMIARYAASKPPFTTRTAIIEELLGVAFAALGIDEEKQS